MALLMTWEILTIRIHSELDALHDNLTAGRPEGSTSSRQLVHF